MTRTKENILTNKPVFLTKPLWWSLFALDTFILSKCFHTFKTFTLTPDLNHGLLLTAALLAFVLVLSVLVFDTYATEKAKGNVHNSFFLFEWAYARWVNHSHAAGGTAP